MTTDDFTESARAEAERQFPAPLYSTAWSESEVQIKRALWEAGAEWARDYLAAQEPTEEEVEAAARAISAEQDRRIGLKAGAWWGGAEYRRNFAREDARAALSAARAARRDEEKR